MQSVIEYKLYLALKFRFTELWVYFRITSVALITIFIEGKYVGLIDSVSSKTDTYSTGSGKDTTGKTIIYEVTLDDFADKREIKKMLSEEYGKRKSAEAEFIFIERFSARSKIEVAGYYTKKAGELMNSRNNWRLGGAAVATAIFLIAPPTLVVYSTAAAVAGISSIVSLCKDYKANLMLKKAGDAMMSK
jgi:hypothetical protein